MTITDPALAKAASIMLDLITGQANDQTIERASELEQEAPREWQENQWLRMVGGAVPGSLDPDFIRYLSDELDQESEV